MQNTKPNLFLIKLSEDKLSGDDGKINHLINNINNTPSISNSFNIFNLQISGLPDGIPNSVHASIPLHQNHNTDYNHNNWNSNALHNNGNGNGTGPPTSNALTFPSTCDGINGNLQLNSSRVNTRQDQLQQTRIRKMEDNPFRADDHSSNAHGNAISGDHPLMPRTNNAFGDRALNHKDLNANPFRIHHSPSNIRTDRNHNNNNNNDNNTITQCQTKTSKAHNTSKDGIDRFKCDICLKRFRHKSNLKVHQKIHGSTAYECDFCKKKFARHSNLKQHRRVHTNERPYKCDQCGAGFNQKHTLLDHERLHSGDKPFKCNYCGRAFTVRHNMVAHKRIHTGEKPYQCTVCSKRFSSKSGMNQHSKTHRK